MAALRTYWIVPRVWLYHEVPADPDDPEDDLGPMIGYYITLGVTAESEDVARGLIDEAITDGRIDWDASQVKGVVPEHLDAAVVARSKNWAFKGIWYRGGRMLFTRDDEEPVQDGH
jgi:hypothetical protein